VRATLRSRENGGLPRDGARDSQEESR
jgi:hypothetical protein